MKEFLLKLPTQVPNIGLQHIQFTPVQQSAQVSNTGLQSSAHSTSLQQPVHTMESSADVSSNSLAFNTIENNFQSGAVSYNRGRGFFYIPQGYTPTPMYTPASAPMYSHVSAPVYTPASAPMYTHASAPVYTSASACTPSAQFTPATSGFAPLCSGLSAQAHLATPEIL
ncbi:hypothetical protein V6N13_095600 [Hibiscus sabdariffa]